MPSEPDAQTVLSFSEAVRYQTGSVVSRTLLKKPAGNVTLFAFDEGESLSEHTTPYDALLVVVDGKVEVTIAENAFSLSKGEMIVLPANVPHAVKALTQFKMMLVMIHD